MQTLMIYTYPTRQGLSGAALFHEGRRELVHVRRFEEVEDLRLVARLHDSHLMRRLAGGKIAAYCYRTLRASSASSGLQAAEQFTTLEDGALKTYSRREENASADYKTHHLPLIDKSVVIRAGNTPYEIEHWAWYRKSNGGFIGLPPKPRRDGSGLSTAALTAVEAAERGLRTALVINEFEHLVWLERSDGALETATVTPVADLPGVESVATRLRAYALRSYLSEYGVEELGKTLAEAQTVLEHAAEAVAAAGGRFLRASLEQSLQEAQELYQQLAAAHAARVPQALVCADDES